MRNLKKVLCLSLALVMLLGMMVVGAGAQGALDVYPDKDSINPDYAEAVDLLTAIDVLEGDGNFRPGDTLTREQAAKIVAYVALGRDAAEALAVTKAPFADVAATRWSAGYIAYCANVGIINGWNGKFDPTAPVTGYQFAKMLLCLLGYGQNNEYVGGNWALNVSKDGVTTGLFSRLSYVGDTALTREQAAQLAYNAVKMNMVAYSPLYGTYTFYTYEFGAQTLLGTKAEKVFKVRPDADNVDGYGYNYEYWYKIGKKDPITDNYITDTILGTETKAALTANNLYKGYDWDDAASLYVNGERKESYVGGTDDTDISPKAVLKNVSTKFFAPFNGYTANVVDEDGDGDADKIIVVTEYLAEVKAVNKATASAERSIKLQIYDDAGTITVDKIETEEFKKGDMILVVPSASTYAPTDFAEPLSMKLAESFTGSVSAYYLQTKNGETNGSVTVDGVKYSYNGIFCKQWASAKAALGYDLAQTAYELNDATYEFYMDSLGNVIGVELVEAAIGDYAYILDVGEDAFEDYNSVKVVLSDGTVGTYIISNKSSKCAYDAGGEKGDNTKVVNAGEVYAYSINAKGEIVLTDLSDGTVDGDGLGNTTDAYSEFENYKAAADGFVKSESTFIYKDASSNYGIAYATDETVFIYVKGTSVKGYYVGKANAPTIEDEAAAAFAIETKSGVDYIEVVFIVDEPATAITTSYLYVASDVVGYSKNVKGDAVNFYDVIIDGEKVRIATADSLTKGALYYYAVDEDLFLPEDPNAVEGGQYETDAFTGKVETGFVIDKLVNGVMVDNDRPAGSNMDILVADANATDVDGTVATGVTVNKGDTITVVYKTSGDVKIALDIYITTDVEA